MEREKKTIKAKCGDDKKTKQNNKNKMARNETMGESKTQCNNTTRENKYTQFYDSELDVRVGRSVRHVC